MTNGVVVINVSREKIGSQIENTGHSNLISLVDIRDT